MMNTVRLIVASLLFHWRTNLAVALGVAAGAAVLTGAMLVGDSMHGSLRDLTFRRLGPIDEVLVTDRFFREELAEEVARAKTFKQHFTAAVPTILLTASLQADESSGGRRANRVNLIGCDERFWKLDPGVNLALSRRQVVLNGPTAAKLDVGVGEEIVVYLAPMAAIPSESLFGRKDKSADSLRLTVHAILGEEGLGRFSIRPSQQEPLNAYVSLAALQKTLELDEPKRVNAILVAGKAAGADPSPDGHATLAKLLRPTPADFGLRVQRIERAELSYFNITSDRMLLDEATEEEVVRMLDGENLQLALTYLANKIHTKPPDPNIPPRERLDGIGYSTVTAIDFQQAAPFGPLISTDGKPIGPLDSKQDGIPPIVLNEWAADDLNAKPGDTIYLSYFEPESTHGEGIERTRAFRLAAVAKLDGVAADRDLTPTVPSVTDAQTISSWDPPFHPFYWEWLRTRGEPGEESHKDEDYWQANKATPKAFVSLADGRQLWKSRFGQASSIRVHPAEGMTVDSLRERLRLDPARLGFAFQPVKQQGLDASKGTTPFNGLFLGFSFFIIAAAMMLVALMFRLGIDRRAAELGILVAVGFSRRKIARLLSAEGLVVAVLGSLLGVPIGIAYAALMLHGLRTWWVDAVGPPFLQLHTTWLSLTIGLASGVVVAFLATRWSVRRTRKIPPGRLLAGLADEVELHAGQKTRLAGRFACGMLIGAAILGLLAIGWSETARAGAFFGSGSMVLAAVLIAVRARLRRGTTGPAVAVGSGNLLRLAVRNATRNPGRSTLTIGLVASATFLIVAISAFHLDPAGQTSNRDGGTGGFALVAETDQPIYHDPNTDQGRARLSFSAADRKLLADTRTFSLRANRGDDASCLNLYQPRQPRVLGVPEAMIRRGGFAWAGSAAETPEQAENPWRLLEKDLGNAADGKPIVPVVIDMNTAMYSLHLWMGVGETYDIIDSQGHTVHLQVVGLLANSIFQGDLLIAESAFKEHFPEVAGYRFFLSDTPPKKTGDVVDAMDRTLGDFGISVETSGDRLAGFFIVQNTYLLTFQSLGGLGLLLGTFGLAAVQMRNVLERRGELALLRATGFRRATLGTLVMLENGLLLCAGLAGGILAATVAVLPHLLTRAAVLPWTTLIVTLALVLTVGLLAGLTAVRAAMVAPIMGTLREE